MNVEINYNSLRTVMEDFYLLTGITIVFYKENEELPLLCVPELPCSFCRQMKEHASSRYLCLEEDSRAMNLCRQKQSFLIYHCHAGLSEACAPLVIDDETVGYFMFGQISEAPDADELRRHLLDYAEHQLHIPIQGDPVADIPGKNVPQIQAAARIMDSLAQYTIHQDIIRIRRHHFVTSLNQHILPRLCEDLSADSIARGLGISRSKLYQNCSTYLGTGIASYVMNLRINHAKELLVKTSLPIADIAASCGFQDYNYFYRVFKKKAGTSAGTYRNRVGGAQ